MKKKNGKIGKRFNQVYLSFLVVRFCFDAFLFSIAVRFTFIINSLQIPTQEMHHYSQLKQRVRNG